MGGVEVLESVCYWCKGSCGLRVLVKDGKLQSLEPDPSWPDTVYPPNEACLRRKAAVEYFYNPGRLNHPLKRAGERGEGKWEEITWKQALDEIAVKIGEVVKEYGPEAVTTTGGTDRTMPEYGSRFLHLLGSPNYIGQERVCFGGRSTVADAVVGMYPNFSISPKSRCIILLGVEPLVSRPWVGSVMLDAMKNGAKMIVLDPRKTDSAKRSDAWLQVRVGTDAAVLLGMCKVIVDEELYDREFVENWCHGFKELCEHLDGITLEWVEEVSGVPADRVASAARLYANNRPGTMIEGMGIEHSYQSSQIFHARWILACLAGNIDVEGGEEQWGPTGIVSEREVEAADALSPEQWRRALGTERFHLFSYDAQQILMPATSSVWGRAPNVWLYQTQAHGPTSYRAMLTGEPYPIRAVITTHSNPLVTQANTRLVYNALKSLDLYVVMDMFMTPSAMLADYVLPAATWLERPDITTAFGYLPFIIVRKACLPHITPDYEHYRDYDLWKGLGERMGQSAHWPWDTQEDEVNHRLAPLGYTLDTAPRKITRPAKFKKYESRGFGTPTKKAELYSTTFEKLGYPPLPEFDEPRETERSQSELAKEYPLTLVTGARHRWLYHSEWRNIESIRKIRPHPLVQVHPETASRFGVSDGEWTWIETKRGRVRQVAQVTDDVPPYLVSAEHGWWLPELRGEEPDLFGVFEVNINVVVDDEPDHCNPLIGTWPLKTCLCRVYHADAGPDGFQLG